MAGNSIDIRELTDNGLAEAAGLISRREYNLSIVRSRQTAESIIKMYASEKNIEYTTLAETIERLFEEGIINRTSRDAFHSIRIYGNKAVHEGDKDPEDAQKAYYLLKNETRTFMSRKTVSVDRTPVKVELRNNRVSRQTDEEDRPRVRRAKEAEGPDTSVLTGSGEKRRSRDGERGERASSGQRGDRPHQGRNGSKSGRSGSGKKNGGKKGSGRSGRSSQGGGFTVYDLLRIVIPVIAIILIIIIIRSLIPAKKPVETTVAETVIETTIEETTMPQTEAPTEPPTEAKVVEYKIKTDGVNVRFADNQDRIYAQLSKGTAIGTVEEIEGSDYVAFKLDGVNVVVRNDMIEPIE